MSVKYSDHFVDQIWSNLMNAFFHPDISGFNFHPGV